MGSLTWFAKHPLLQTIRGLLRVPTYTIVCLQLVIAASVVASNSGTPIGKLITGHLLELGLCLVCIAMWYINGTAINDLADYEIDQINLKHDKDRPLVTGNASKKTVWRVAVLAALTGVMAGYAITWTAGAVMLATVFLNWIYSMPPVRISYRGGLAQALLPLGYVAFPYSLGLIAFSGSIDAASLGILAALYLLFCSRVMLKDFRDVDGDKKHGKLTFLLRHSVDTVAKAALTVYALGITIVCVQISDTPVPFVALPVIFLAGVNLVLFNELAKTTQWKEQRPLLAPIGRVNTAQLVLLVLALMSSSEPMPLTQVVLIMLAVLVTFLWSAYVSLRQQYTITNTR
ncbi:MAG TPA: UbiA family prenyltransferase [Candidatus Limnocylindria bacterium]|nr:UbiA family prenyltransferase [Candidatus Limnocylindria bacterium]